MKIIADQSWYLTSDLKSRVPEGHPKVAFLLVAKGCEIDDQKLNAIPELEEDDATEAKMIDGPPETKEIEGPAAGHKRGRPPKHHQPND